jgi:hypothetical protein
MDAYSLHPWLYQLRHPWHWLTYGQNATAFGIILATAVNLLAVYVLFRTLVTVNRQAQAADRQAEAAEAQAAAARKQTEVMDAQLKFQQKMDAKLERENVFRLAAIVQASLGELESRLGRIQMSAFTQADHSDVAHLFDMLARAVSECQTAALLSIQLLPARKNNLIHYCDDLATLTRSGRMDEDIQKVKALRAKYADLIFCLTLGGFDDVPESSA